MYLQNHVLREILKLIEHDNRSRRKFASKWYSTVNYLYHNTGLSIDRIAQASSVAKNTSLNSSDLDIIFSLSPDQSRAQLHPRLVEQFQTGYGEVAQVSQDSTAIHIKFNTDIEINVILLTQRDFKCQYEGVQDIKQLNQSQQYAIILTKFAFEQAKIISSIPEYKIEKIAFSFDNTDLATLVENIINRLNFDTNRAGLSTFNVISYLR